MAIRKDANTLTTSERQELTSAILELKRRGIYDQFVLRHANANMRAIHRSPAFLPWHRRYLWDFERELQRVSGNPDLGLPYWNWPEGGSGASMWDDDLLGGDGHPVSQVVSSGPFRSGQWTVINSSGQPAGPLTRAFGRESWATELPALQEILDVLSITPYDAAPWNESVTQSFRNQLEGFRGPNLHNRGHGWVGGSMLPMTSPNDPVFFMNHCMVDKIWHEWQIRFPRQGYLPASGGPFGQNLNDPMDSTPATPIDRRPIDVLLSSNLNIEYDAVFPGTGQDQNQTVELSTNGTLVDGNISSTGEIDLYHFDVTDFNTYVAETSGASDTVMTLFGPDDHTLQIALNDDGGENFNSRISQSLPAGRYFISIRLFDNSATGSYQIRVNTESSDNPVIPQLEVNGPATDAEITNPREIDLFRFSAQSSGVYSIETSGSTDTFMTVFGPDSETLQIATDDDSGFLRNARLQLQLQPGEYFVRIRHYSNTGTGAYQIQVSQSN
ncbi:MAG: tyrosinase family protein [Gammaproteobacteria bacterium]|nr:tyrosinase family protein [Gammaproteobacteria bacterium]